MSDQPLHRTTALQDTRSVTVIIPAYNSDVTLKRCLDSVLAQTVPPAQVIVVNDGSTDSTLDVARSYGQQILVLNQKNTGQAGARNAGLRLAEGRFVAFLDADDYWLPDFIECTTDFLIQRDAAVAVSVGQLHKVWGHPDATVPASLMAGGRCQPIVINNFFEFWADHFHITTGSVLLRRSVCSQAGGQVTDLRISQDLEYWAYIATFGAWGFIPKVAFVTDGSPAVAAQGWFRKYKRRRRLCPCVERWQERVVPRLSQSDWAGFRRIRGRVAMSYAHAKILSGNHFDALQIVRTYGDDFRPGRPTTLMRLGCRLGGLGWWVACMTLRSFDVAKGVLFTIHMHFLLLRSSSSVWSVLSP